MTMALSRQFSYALTWVSPHTVVIEFLGQALYSASSTSSDMATPPTYPGLPDKVNDDIRRRIIIPHQHSTPQLPPLLSLVGCHRPWSGKIPKRIWLGQPYGHGMSAWPWCTPPARSVDRRPLGSKTSTDRVGLSYAFKWVTDLEMVWSVPRSRCLQSQVGHVPPVNHSARVKMGMTYEDQSCLQPGSDLRPQETFSISSVNNFLDNVGDSLSWAINIGQSSAVAFGRLLVTSDYRQYDKLRLCTQRTPSTSGPLYTAVFDWMLRQDKKRLHQPRAHPHSKEEAKQTTHFRRPDQKRKQE
ncbi:hypothetical protein C8Q74DRAFT_1218992 [Fomes fomentarius]|nr:hypothetical protein C8Q74DRAFT_1218992 [Fomes fomentarius]